MQSIIISNQGKNLTIPISNGILVNNFNEIIRIPPYSKIKIQEILSNFRRDDPLVVNIYGFYHISIMGTPDKGIKNNSITVILNSLRHFNRDCDTYPWIELNNSSEILLDSITIDFRDLSNQLIDFTANEPQFIYQIGICLVIKQ